MPVITVSGYLASGARDVAQQAAAELRLEFVDQMILVEAARELGVTVAAMEDRDERTTSIGERVAAALGSLMERSAAVGTFDPVSGGGMGLETVLARTYGEAAELPSGGARGQLDDDRYIKTLTSVIKGVATRGDVVLLGRGSQAILHDDPATLHVYVAAAKEWRIDNLVTHEGMSRPDAERRMEKSDANRRAFHLRYFKMEFNNPHQYDVAINAGHISAKAAARMIAIAAAERSPRPG
jgi:cytidylate kinase